MAAISAYDAAAAIRQRIPGVPKVKLHKLLYMAQGFHLAQIGEPLFREDIEAWRHGPVVAELWRAERYEAEPRQLEHMDNTHLGTIGYVCSRYGNNSGGDLEAITHEHAAWSTAFWRHIQPGERRVIDTAAIGDQFAAVLKVDEQDREFRVDPQELDAFLATSRDRARRGERGTPDTRESLLARRR